jgi:fructose-bisphosphate aldolase class II
MSLVPGRELLAEAARTGQARGAFNFSNLEFLQAIVGAAADEQTPVFLAASEGAISYAGLDCIVALARAAALTCPVPLALHLDHGKDPDLIQRCIEAGFTSVMIDASDQPLAENTRLTREVVARAHAKDVSVEAELGRLSGTEDAVSVTEREAVLVNPADAARFVAKTGVDSLAPAIGTSHGAFKFKGEPRLDLDRLARTRDLTGNLPLVLHGASTVPPDVVERCRESGLEIAGASGVPESELVQAIRAGVRKVNVDTDLRLAFAAEVRRVLRTRPSEFDPRRYLGPASDAVRALVRRRIRLFRDLAA